MLESPRGLRLLVLAAIVLCIVASLTGARAGDDKGGLRIAIVDMQRLNDEYTIIKNWREMADKQEKDFKTEVEVIQRNQLLPEADRKALVALKIKEVNTPNGLSKAEQDKKAALEKQSRDLNENSIKISKSSLGTAGPDEIQTLKEYTKRSDEASDYVKNRQQTLSKEVEDKARELQVQVQENMQKSLSEVAKKNGYTLVLNKQIAPYAEFDCTKDVLALLNKKDKG